MASKLEETEKRRQELVNQRDAKIEAKKGTENESEEELLQNLALKMTKKGQLKYAYDRQGKLVLIQQTEGIQRQERDITLLHKSDFSSHFFKRDKIAV